MTIHTIIGLKTSIGLITPVHMSQHTLVYTTPPTCSNLRRPETEEAMQRISNWYSQIPDTGSFHQSHSKQSSSLPVSHAGESWNNTSQDDAWGEKASWIGVSLIPTPKKGLLSKRPEHEKKKVFVNTMIVFQKPVFIVKLLRCHVNLTCMPTHAENHPSAHKVEYIYSNTHKHATIIAAVANKNFNSSNFSFLLHLLLISWVFFPLWTAGDHREER